MLNLSRITGTDVATNVDQITRLFGDWGVATGDQTGVMDKLFRASQASGIGLDDLQGSLVQFGAPLRNLGFGLDDSMALLAKFNAEGVNTETVFAGMKAGVGKLAKAGEDVPTTFKRVVDEIKTMGPGTEATAKAIELFGQRAGPDLADAIAGGKFEIDEMLGAITGGKDTIQKASDDTADFGEKWQVLKNKIFVGLEPLAVGVFDAVGKAMETLAPIADEVIGGVKAFIGAFRDGGDDVTSSGFAGKLEQFGIIARNVFDTVSKFVREELVPALREMGAYFAAEVLPRLQQLAGIIMNDVVPAIVAIAGWIGENLLPVLITVGQFLVETYIKVWTTLADVFMNYLWPALKAVIEWVSGTLWPALLTLGMWIAETMQPIIKALADLWSTVLWPALQAVAGFIMDTLWPAFLAVSGFISDTFSPIVSAIAWVFSNVVWPALQAVAGFVVDTLIPAVARGAAAFIETGATVGRIAGQIIGFVSGLVRSVARFVSGMWNGISSGIEWAAGTVRSVVDGIVGVVRGIGSRIGDVASAISSPFTSAFNSIKRLWNSTVGGFRFSIPDWIPGVGGKGFSIPSMHSGGVVPGLRQQEQMTLLQAGETVRTREQEARLQQIIGGLASAEPRQAQQVHVNFNGPVTQDGKRWVMDMIEEALAAGITSRRLRQVLR
jgi:phage-related minor tail protein